MAPGDSTGMRALTIAGSDSGGGAGIAADLKTFAAFGVYGMAAVTAVTAQDTLAVHAVCLVDPDLVARQITAVRDDLGVDACKIGMLGSAPIARAVAEVLRQGRLGPVVLDPVLAGKHGQDLLSADGLDVLRRDLLPLATVLTPNLPEAAALLGCELGPLEGEDARREAAAALRRMGPEHVVLKGGHLPDTGAHAGAIVTDLWYDGREYRELSARRCRTRHTHGTGCTFAAALAAGLARGEGVGPSLVEAKRYVSWAIAHAPGFGRGAGPLGQGRPAPLGGGWEGPG